MEKWNKKDWQGKRKDQVEFSYKTIIVSTILLILTVSIYLILK